MTTELSIEHKIAVLLSNIEGIQDYIGFDSAIRELRKDLDHAFSNEASIEEIHGLLSDHIVFYHHAIHVTPKKIQWDPLVHDFMLFKNMGDQILVSEQPKPFPDSNKIMEWLQA